MQRAETRPETAASNANSIKTEHRGHAGNGWVQEPAHKHCANRVSPGTLLIPDFSPSSSFIPSLSFPHLPCSWVLPVHPCVRVCVCVCSGPRDRRSHCWEIRSWFSFFGPTLCCWVKAVYIVFIAEDKGFLSQTLVFKTPSPPRSVPLLCPVGYFIPPFHKQ